MVIGSRGVRDLLCGVVIGSGGVGDLLCGWSYDREVLVTYCVGGHRIGRCW